MSILKVKDLDVKLAEILDDKDLRSLNEVSKYYVRILNDSFYRRKFDKLLKTLPKFTNMPEMNMYKETWKRFYNVAKYALEPNEHRKKIEFAIIQDRDDILSLIFLKYGHKDNSIYDWEETGNDWIDPIQLAISKDSAKCFTYLLEFTLGYYPTAVFNNHAHKIIISKKFQEVLHLRERINGIISSFETGCKSCYSSLYTSDLQDTIVNELYDVDVIPFLHSPFSIFMKSIPRDDLLRYKDIAIDSDRFDLIKLFTIYSSIFR
jgi:hypothetical protein